MTKDKMARILFAVFFTAFLTDIRHADNSGEEQPKFYVDGPLPSMEDFRKQLIYPHKDYPSRISHSIGIHDEPLTFRLPFFGFEYRYIWLHKDGYLFFNYGLNTYPDKKKFPTEHIMNPDKEQDPSLISPWFSRQDIPNNIPGAGIYFKKINLDTMDRSNEWEMLLKKRIILDFQDGMIGSADFEPKHVIIATWKNVTHASNINHDPKTMKTNTYQVVIATDEMRTYAMFNYEKIAWTSEKDVFGGEKGRPPFIGFNAGNRTRAYEFEPYSQEQRVTRLPELGFGNGLNGRFYFQINEEIWQGCCIERELDVNWNRQPTLTFFPRYGNMLGGTLVNITGPCFTKKDSVIICKFDTLEVYGFRRSNNHVTCISPTIIYHGYIPLSVSIDNGGYLFVGKYYVQPPDMAREDVNVVSKTQRDEETGGPDRQEKPSDFVLKWDSLKLSWNLKSPVTISLWGYRETYEATPSLTYIDVLADGIPNGALEHELDLESFTGRWNSGKHDLQFGFIAINLTSPESIKDGVPKSPTLWSRPMPLAWYFRQQWIKRYGNEWKDDMCENWFEQEKYSDRFAITLFRCPCTLQQAELDRGRFAPDLHCNTLRRECVTFHKRAKHCVRSGRPAVGGAGQLCCYDDHDELIRTGDTMEGGRPARSFHDGKYPFKQIMMIPALSHWLHDVAPFFYCCKWSKEEDNSETCDMYKYWRTSQDCSLYQPPGVASVFGDPHYVTFDRVNYTFNGKGEFSLVRVNHRRHKLDVQGRFEQPMSKHKAMHHINGTRLMAVAAKDNFSSVVEFRIRPDSARWRYQMYIIVEGEYVYFWDDSMRVQYFKGVTLYQPEKVFNMSHIVAMFDSGAGVEVMVENGHLAAHVYLPLTYMNKTAGLLGNWSRNEDDEFTSPSGDQNIRPGSTLKQIHQRFGMEWRVTELPNERVGQSLFYHDAVSFTEYDNRSFVPEYEMRPNFPDEFPYEENVVKSVCSDSRTCYFDFLVTGDVDFAVATKKHEQYAQTLASGVRKEEVRCPDLPRPRNGRKSEIKNTVDTTVRFSCDEGYRLVGYENRKCRPTGLWSWGVDPECISEGDYTRKVAGISVGIVLPMLVVGVLCCVCIIGHMRQRKTHYTGERGMYGPTVFEIKENGPRNGTGTTASASTNSSTEKKKLEEDV